VTLQLRGQSGGGGHGPYLTEADRCVSGGDVRTEPDVMHGPLTVGISSDDVVARAPSNSWACCVHCCRPKNKGAFIGPWIYTAP